MYLSCHAQRREMASPATKTKLWISMAHATQSSTARRLAVRAASRGGQPVSILSFILLNISEMIAECCNYVVEIVF
jgi:hypothetical protein